ncbi:hypothetical protein EOE18_18010 [Novosphingobium umbonatum]|uniref:Uncharacterized protein n=1 Tax=Novosphingobium umbonatum TaxID=1908524 RepID=A0A437MWX8_9SPHN|nr:hypothetical protein [Novosphingobium umbonatum]RVU02147.1 hypothetical protein EOE18_18010 [Novosphingobium umbonatum]
MDYDREEMRLRRVYEKTMAAKKKLEERLARQKEEARSAKSRLQATTKSEQWHRMALAWLDRDAGYTGEMASARVWLKEQTMHKYIELIHAYVDQTKPQRIIDIEVAAVRANLVDWTAKGNALLLRRAYDGYVMECQSFRAWQQGHPDNVAWRKKPATRNQLLLIDRQASALRVPFPGKMNRGEAHDWIERHGGNLRLKAAETQSLMATPERRPEDDRRQS